MRERERARERESTCRTETDVNKVYILWVVCLGGCQRKVSTRTAIVHCIYFPCKKTHKMKKGELLRDFVFGKELF